MDKVLVVEDEELIRTMIKLNLEKAGYAVKCCEDAETMLDVIGEDVYDLILLDIMLPGMQGQTALKKIREQQIKTPVIMVTAKSDIDTKMNTFEWGADDYMAKPFNMNELLMRVKAVIRRCRGYKAAYSGRVITIGDFQVDVDKRIASTSQGDITLSKKEIRLLAYLVDRKEETVSPSQILEDVWEVKHEPTSSTVETYIQKFRSLFEEEPDRPKHFVSVEPKGYRFTK